MIRKSKNTLSDKIADILNTAPASYDPEDDIYDETRAKINNDYEQVSETEELTSKIRKQNVELLEDVDKRYVGKKGSRNSLQDSDEWETEDEGLSTDEGEALDGVPGTTKLSSDEEDSAENESDEDDDDDENDDNFDNNFDLSQNDDSTFKHMSQTDVPTQVKKGTSVRNQLNLWESLLEIRIQLQKCLVASNKMPQYDTFNQIKEDENFKSSITKTKKNLTNVLEKFLSLQLLLLKQYSETKTLLKSVKKPESDEEIPSDTDEEKSEGSDEENEEIPKKRKKLIDFEQEISSRHEKYKDYRDSVIQKWNEKTRLSTGKSAGVSNSVLQQINFILQDKQKLVRRTQLKRSEYEIIGKNVEQNQDSESRSTDEHDAEIFDDDDFYHQLLRELIEFKSAGVTDPVQMSRQWIMLQKFRSKMKKKVDTKASKGRKVRYAVHSKLVNFMAPIDNNTWTEESKNELYSSLFGSNNLSKTTT